MSAGLPDFIAIGPPRTGTTWLHGVLYHRATLPEGVKETRFFDLFYSRGLDWYSACFGARLSDRPVGEISPTYFRWQEARDRIAKHIPRCKIICTLREPVSRAYSQYRQLHTLGLVRGSFEREVLTNDKLAEFTRYGSHLTAWYERFGRQQVAVFFYEDLETDPQKFADDICLFLGLPPVPLTPDVNRHLDRNEVKNGARSRLLAYNARRLRYWLQAHHYRRASEALERIGFWRFCTGGGREFPPLRPGIELGLRKHFLPEVEEIERLTGRNLSHWKPGGCGRSPL